MGFSFFHNSYRLHVIDLDPSSVTSGGWLEDTSLVEKYKISDEAYEKRDGKALQTLFWSSITHILSCLVLNCFFLLFDMMNPRQTCSSIFRHDVNLHFRKEILCEFSLYNAEISRL